MKLKRQLNLLIAGMFMALQMPLFLFAPQTALAAPADKVFVCKYIGTPGTDERLQTGDNPISVSSNSIPNYQGPGSYFADAQGRSFVLMVDNTAPGPTGDPSVSACPAPAPNVIAVPATPSTLDPCNPEGVTNNVEWENALPTDTATIDWSVSNGGATRTATLIGSNVEWSDGTTAPKVFNLPADSGDLCPPEQKVTICHATSAAKNPYVKIEVSTNAADGVAGNSGGQPDHYGEHQGPIFDPAVHENGDNWGDIIPPVPPHHTGLNWTTEGQAIYNNDCEFPEEPEEPAAPTAQAAIIPCVPGTDATDVVIVSVTNTDDATNDSVSYTVTLGGQTKNITLADGQSGSVTFSGLAAGTYAATVTGDDQTTVTTNSVTVNICEDEGDILGETITGGRGAGQVESAVVTRSVLADTGTDVAGVIFAALTIIGLTGALAVTTRRAYFNQ